MKTSDALQTWRQVADHYSQLAGEHTDPSSQLACLILADYCMYEDNGDRGGPTPEMIQLAESILGVGQSVPFAQVRALHDA
jgi:hypothetical protein